MLKYALNAGFQYKKAKDATILLAINVNTNFVGYVLIIGKIIRVLITLVILYLTFLFLNLSINN